MTTHLPECFETWQIPRKCNICDALRACEQRVLDTAVQRVEALPWGMTYWMNYEDGRNPLKETIAAIREGVK